VRFDIAIVGAGPVGLSFARALGDTGLRVALIEKRPVAELADPAFDGREIAITRMSARLMGELGQWLHIDPQEIAPLRRARVLNGPSPFAMLVDAGSAQGELGYLIPNHLIRKAAFESARAVANVTLMDGRSVNNLRRTPDGMVIELAGGDSLAAGLVVAADSRFSETRRAMGIPAGMHDFARTMLVFRMELTRPHEETAWEWFGYGQTLALLPLHGNQASVVLTLPHEQINRLLQHNENVFSRDIQQRFDNRLGAMRLTSTRHAYPLVAVYAERFVAPRFACIGDAAVGMHPVTAHGFNFGLRSVHTLASRLHDALARGEDFAARGVLDGYQREHRHRTRPLYLATNAIARLYCDDRPPARVLRNLALRAGQRFTPFRHALGSVLSDVPKY